VPGYGWSAPASYPLGASSLTTSSFTASTLGDISPYACPIPAGLLNIGTRIRLVAHGSYTGTSTTVTLQWGFYLNSVNTAIASAIVLGVGPVTTVASLTGCPWLIEYWGHVAAVSGAGTGAGASFVGRGRFTVGASLTAFVSPTTPIPQTLAAVTVAQAAGAGSTITEQNIQLGLTPGASVTNLTNVITDELTCELIG
jgi:hypothetical protein